MFTISRDKYTTKFINAEIIVPRITEISYLCIFFNYHYVISP